MALNTDIAQGYSGDEGSAILIETNLVLTNATILRINVYTPNKEYKIWEAQVDSTNPKYMKYVVKSGDFTVPGTYFLQPEVQLGVYHGKGETCKVLIKQSFA